MAFIKNKKPYYGPGQWGSGEHREINTGFCPQGACNPVRETEMQTNRVLWETSGGGRQSNLKREENQA